jgi:hypothetical protein
MHAETEPTVPQLPLEIWEDILREKDQVEKREASVADKRLLEAFDEVAEKLLTMDCAVDESQEWLKKTFVAYPYDETAKLRQALAVMEKVFIVFSHHYNIGSLDVMGMNLAAACYRYEAMIKTELDRALSQGHKASKIPVLRSQANGPLRTLNSCMERIMEALNEIKENIAIHRRMSACKPITVMQLYYE